jgi:hypothetical protein
LRGEPSSRISESPSSSVQYSVEYSPVPEESLRSNSTPSRRTEGGRGVQLSEKEKELLAGVCIKNQHLYGLGLSGWISTFWTAVSVELKQGRGGKDYTATSCQRLMKTLLATRRKEIELLETGEEKTDSGLWRAIDTMIEIDDAWTEQVETQKKSSEEDLLKQARALAARDNLLKPLKEKRKMPTSVSKDADSDELIRVDSSDADDTTVSPQSIALRDASCETDTSASIPKRPRRKKRARAGDETDVALATTTADINESIKLMLAIEMKKLQREEAREEAAMREKSLDESSLSGRVDALETRISKEFEGLKQLMGQFVGQMSNHVPSSLSQTTQLQFPTETSSNRLGRETDEDWEVPQHFSFNNRNQTQ